jgi:hypothetical protein
VHYAIKEVLLPLMLQTRRDSGTEDEPIFLTFDGDDIQLQVVEVLEPTFDAIDSIVRLPLFLSDNVNFVTTRAHPCVFHH